MSFEAIKWALDLNIPPGPKFVLVTLASYADDQNNAWPSFATLAQKTSYPRRSIIRFIDYLLEKRLLEKKAEAYRRSNMYKLNLSLTRIVANEEQIEDENIVDDSDDMSPLDGDTMSPSEKLIVTPCHLDSDTMSLGGDTMSPSIVTPCHPNNQLNNQLTSIEPPDYVRTSGGTPSRFEEFWKIYPRHEKKKNAREVWRRKNSTNLPTRYWLTWKSESSCMANG